jgi:hypothetical protein
METAYPINGKIARGNITKFCLPLFQIILKQPLTSSARYDSIYLKKA